MSNQVNALEQQLITTADKGQSDPTSVSAIPGMAGILSRADNLGQNVQPLDFTSQDAASNALGQNADQIQTLLGNLGVQTATAAQLADALARAGQANSQKRAQMTENAVSGTEQIGAQENQQLAATGLSERSQVALGALNKQAQQVQQQALSNRADLADKSVSDYLNLAQQKGTETVRQAGTTANLNEQAIETAYQAAQWAFWTKIATGVLTAAGAVAGTFVGGPAGTVAGAAAGAAAGGALSSAGGSTSYTTQALPSDFVGPPAPNEPSPSAPYQQTPTLNLPVQ